MVAAAILLTPLLTSKTIIGNVTELGGCKVMRLDPNTHEVVATDETVEVHQVDHGVKFVQAQTLEGAVYGLGFVHARDRLWQMHFYRALS